MDFSLRPHEWKPVDVNFDQRRHRSDKQRNVATLRRSTQKCSSTNVWPQSHTRTRTHLSSHTHELQCVQRDGTLGLFHNSSSRRDKMFTSNDTRNKQSVPPFVSRQRKKSLCVCGGLVGGGGGDRQVRAHTPVSTPGLRFRPVSCGWAGRRRRFSQNNVTRRGIPVRPRKRRRGRSEGGGGVSGGRVQPKQSRPTDVT